MDDQSDDLDAPGGAGERPTQSVQNCLFNIKGGSELNNMKFTGNVITIGGGKSVDTPQRPIEQMTNNLVLADQGSKIKAATFNVKKITVGGHPIVEEHDASDESGVDEDEDTRGASGSSAIVTECRADVKGAEDEFYDATEENEGGSTLKNDLLAALPTLPPERQKSLVNQLETGLGVFAPTDFQYLKEHHVGSLLSGAQQERFMEYFSQVKKGEVYSNTQDEAAENEHDAPGLKQKLSLVFPTLPAGKLDNLISKLNETCGVYANSDFKYVKDETLKDLLPAAQQARIIKYVKQVKCGIKVGEHSSSLCKASNSGDVTALVYCEGGNVEGVKMKNNVINQGFVSGANEDMSDLRKELSAILPTLPEETLNAVATDLTKRCGIYGISDFDYIHEPDLKNAGLPRAQRARLMEYAKKKKREAGGTSKAEVETSRKKSKDSAEVETSRKNSPKGSGSVNALVFARGGSVKNTILSNNVINQGKPFILLQIFLQYIAHFFYRSYLSSLRRFRIETKIQI